MTCWLLIKTLMSSTEPPFERREAFEFESRALDEARKLWLAEEKRMKKDARQGPAMIGLTLEREDGTTIKGEALRRLARGIRD